MTENAKTGIFWGIAAVIALAATITAWPRSTDLGGGREGIGKPLFPKFKDVLAVANLKINRFDDEMGQLSSFEVTKNKQTQAWSIPSHDGYPADAQDQIRNASTAFLNLEILDVASEIKEDHEKFGVLEPNADSVKVGDEGVGRLIAIEDEAGDDLVNLIIGSEVKDNPAQRFVRIPTQDITYVVKFDDGPLTTRFEDWIEDNLLNLTSFDIQNIGIRDYSIIVTAQGGKLQKSFDADLTVNEASDWTLDRLVSYKGTEATEESLAEGEEIDGAKLGELRSALDDLKIVDVVRKPDGLSADLKTDADMMKDESAMQSLYARGFYPQATPDGKAEVFAANGELTATLKDGVEYLLRFGQIDRKSMQAGDADKEEGDEEAEIGGLNRYLLVTARVNKSIFPEPELMPEPKSWDELHPKVSQKQPEPKKEEAITEVKPEESEAPAADDASAKDKLAKGSDSAKEAPAEKAGSKTESTENTTETSGEGSADGSGGGQEENDEAKADDTKTADSEAAEEKVESAEAEPAAAKQPSEFDLTDEEKQEELEAAQEQVRKANQRKIDARNDQLEEAQKRVRDLNERFADWYYVVPESEYRKIHLSRDELIKKKSDPVETVAPNGLPPVDLPGPGASGN